MSKQEKPLSFYLSLRVKGPFCEIQVGPVWASQRVIVEAIRQAKLVLDIFEHQAAWGDP